MPSFTCKVCGREFSVAQAALDKYPGWTPGYCRDHSPKRGAASDGGRGRSTARGAGSSGAKARAASPRADRGPSSGPNSGVFTDGSCHPNPGPGGWGLVWVKDGEILAERRGHDPDTTNNRMELTALIEAYRLLPEDAAEVVYSDSDLCVKTLTTWAPSWAKRGWRRSGGPIKNLDLVKPLYELYQRHPQCEVRWIEAHVGHRWNEYADALASAWLSGAHRGA